MNLKFFRMFEHVPQPRYMTNEAACFDVTAVFKTSLIDGEEAETVGGAILVENDALHVLGGQVYKIPTGLIFDIPEGYVLKVYIRSGSAYNKGLVLANGVGIIDADYTDPLYILVLATRNTVIKRGERIAQCELVKLSRGFIAESPDRPDQRGDRKGGLGSTDLSQNLAKTPYRPRWLDKLGSIFRHLAAR